MHLRALHTAGQLDISSQEQLQGESEVFRLSLWPGQVVYVKDHWRYLRNIDSAISQGLLQVVDYDFSHVGEEVTHAEMEVRIGEITLESIVLDAVPVESPNGVITTFTLPGGARYVSGKVVLVLNGQTLTGADVVENPGRTSLTLSTGSAPKPGDQVRFIYVSESSA